MKLTVQKMYAIGLGLIFYPHKGLGLHIWRIWIGFIKETK